MTKQKILKKLMEKKTYEEIAKEAELLLYKLCPLERSYTYSSTFYYLFKEDLEKLGYKVFEVATKEKTKLEGYLYDKGYLYTDYVYFSPKKKEVWSVKDKIIDGYVNMEENFLNPSNTKNLPKLISKEQFAELLTEKIMERLKRWKRLKSCFNSLIKDEKKIEEALKKAHYEGLIKLNNDVR